MALDILPRSVGFLWMISSAVSWQVRFLLPKCFSTAEMISWSITVLRLSAWANSPASLSTVSIAESNSLMAFLTALSEERILKASLKYYLIVLNLINSVLLGMDSSFYFLYNTRLQRRFCAAKTSAGRSDYLFYSSSIETIWTIPSDIIISSP